MSITFLDIISLIATFIFFFLLWYLDTKKNLNFGLLTLLATGLGVISGLIFHRNFRLTVITGTICTRILNAFVIPLFLSLIGHLNPSRFFKGTSQAGAVAFTSRSSVGTLPVTVSNLEKIGVNPDVASFTAGLGANLGMPGCAGIRPMLLRLLSLSQRQKACWMKKPATVLRNLLPYVSRQRSPYNKIQFPFF